MPVISHSPGRRSKTGVAVKLWPKPDNMKIKSTLVYRWRAADASDAAGLAPSTSDNSQVLQDVIDAKVLDLYCRQDPKFHAQHMMQTRKGGVGVLQIGRASSSDSWPVS